VDETDLGFYPVIGFIIRGVESSDFATTVIKGGRKVCFHDRSDESGSGLCAMVNFTIKLFDLKVTLVGLVCTSVH
jgi:hypothetical protein